jgi:hypothetical protein
MLDINALAPPWASVHQCGCSGHEVFDRDHVELARFSIHPHGSRQCAPKGAKQVNSNGMRSVDQLQQQHPINDPYPA